MKIIVLSLYIIFLSFTLYSQCDTLRNETHIFWCEEYTLQFSDFQDTSRLAKHLEWCESKSLCWGAYTGLFSVMDIPKKKKTQSEETIITNDKNEDNNEDEDDNDDTKSKPSESHPNPSSSSSRDIDEFAIELGLVCNKCM